MKKLTASSLVMFFLVIFMVAAYATTMEEGESRTVTVGNKGYSFEVLIIEDQTPASVTFSIDGQVTPSLGERQQFRLPDNILMTIDDINLNEGGEAGLGDIVTFSFSEYCGDSICSANENCGSCIADCSCQSGYFCNQASICQQKICGDNICSAQETCDTDSCCKGKQIDLLFSQANCGTCGNRCGFQEKCSAGVCINSDEQQIEERGEAIVCGDSICQENEKNCCQDCECKKGYACEENSCVAEDACGKDIDCADKNPCTTNVCDGKPKECSYKNRDGCRVNNQCIPQGETMVIEDVESFCSTENVWKSKKEEKSACKESYECQSNRCVEGACFVERPTLFQTMLRWFGIF